VQFTDFSKTLGKVAPGDVVFSKKYLNQEHSSFLEVSVLFLKEAACDETPACCVLACAGPILNNSVMCVSISFEDKVTRDLCHLQKIFVDLQI
jgi:glucokinase